MCRGSNKLERWPHLPVAGLLIEHAHWNIVVHASGNIRRRDHHCEGAVITRGVGLSQAPFLKKVILTGSVTVMPGG
jgi:hypothetical protein